MRKELTQEEIRQNRLKFAAGLQEPHREKTIGKLENFNSPNQRCCLGHGCDIFNIEREVDKETEDIKYGKEQSTGLAPKELIDILGLTDDCGTIERGHDDFINNSLTIMNDQTESTIQDIGKLIEGWVEGGEGTPFVELSKYKKTENIRPLSELLQITKDHMINNQPFHGKHSICLSASRLLIDAKITNSEFTRLIEYVKANSPLTFNVFMHRLTEWRWKGHIVCFWWDAEKIKPRIKWLDKHIKLNNK